MWVAVFFVITDLDRLYSLAKKALSILSTVYNYCNKKVLRAVLLELL